MANIEYIAEKLHNVEDLTIIDTIVSPLNRDTLVSLFDKFMQDPVSHEYSIIHILVRLYEDSGKYAAIISEYLQNFQVSHQKDQILKAKAIENVDISLALVERALTCSIPQGAASGVIMSWLIDVSEQVKEKLKDFLVSERRELTQCAITTLYCLLCSKMKSPNTDEVLNILREHRPSIPESSYFQYLSVLHCASESNPETFEPIIMQILNDYGVSAAKEYAHVIAGREHCSQSLLHHVIEILRSDPDCNEELPLLLARMYRVSPEYVVDHVRNIVNAGLMYYQLPDFLKREFNTYENDPLLRLIEDEIDKCNHHFIILGHYLLEDFTVDSDQWLQWCEKWRGDEKKKSVVYQSLRDILSDQLEKKDNNLKRRAVDLVKDIAQKEGLNYENATKSISMSNKPSDYVEAMRALSIMKIIQERGHRLDINIEQLKENLVLAPNIREAYGEKFLLKDAKSDDTHYITRIFSQGSGMKGQLTDCQKYYENVFTVLHQHEITIRRKKLQDKTNALDILSEAEVFSRLARYFKIEPEHEIPKLGQKRLEAIIEYNNEKVAIEIASIDQSLTMKNSTGGITFAGSRPKNALLTKFQRQLGSGENDPGIPIIIILNIRTPFERDFVLDSLYGQQISISKRLQNGHLIIEGFTRATNGFFHEEKVQIVTAVVVIFRQDLTKKNTFQGYVWRPPYEPLNQVSQKFLVQFRNALYGQESLGRVNELQAINGVGKKLAQLMYDNGVEDLNSLSLVNVKEIRIKGISNTRLSNFKNEAKRILVARSTSGLWFLKGMTEDDLDRLYKSGIYLIEDILNTETVPEEVPEALWKQWVKDAYRILTL